MALLKACAGHKIELEKESGMPTLEKLADENIAIVTLFQSVHSAVDLTNKDEKATNLAKFAKPLTLLETYLPTRVSGKTKLDCELIVYKVLWGIAEHFKTKKTTKRKQQKTNKKSQVL